MNEDVANVIAKARKAQQQYEQLHDVQLELVKENEKDGQRELDYVLERESRDSQS